MFRRSGRTIPIVTGFIGATEDGQTTTIGRNGLRLQAPRSSDRRWARR